MPHLRILVYLVSFGCGAALINSVVHLYPKYPRAYLKKYGMHVAVLNILALLSMLYRYFNLFPASGATPGSGYRTGVYSLIFFLAIIVTYLNLATFLMVLGDLLERGGSRLAKIAFPAGGGLSLLLAAQGLWRAFAGGDPGLLKNDLIRFDLAVDAAIVVFAAAVLAAPGLLRNNRRRKIAVRFLALYGSTYGMLLSAILLKKAFSPFFYFAFATAFLSLNLLPLIFLGKLLGREEVLESLNFSGEDADPWFSKYGVSGREKEIIRLLLAGRSNKEIAEALFISVKTVKYHLYNIYKKLGIKNRLELINLVLKAKNIAL